MLLCPSSLWHTEGGLGGCINVLELRYSKDVVTLIFVGRVEPFLHARDTVGWVGGSWICSNKEKT